jgi:hypothetical protein
MIRLSPSTLFLILCTAFCFAFYLQIYPNLLNPNEASRLLLISAIVDDGTMTIDKAIQRYGDTGDKSQFQGRFYSNKAIGYSLLALPFYVLIRPANLDADLVVWVLRIFVNWVPLALFYLFFFRYLKNTLQLKAKAYLVAAGFFLGSLIFPFSQLFISHVLNGLLWFVAFVIMTSPSSTRRAFIAGSLLGITFLLEFPSLLVIVLFAIWAFFKKRELLLPMCLGAVIFSIPNFLYNHVVFGHPFSWPYLHASTMHHVEAHSKGYVGIQMPSLSVLWELTFGTRRGFFYFMPHMIFGLFGLLGEKEKRSEALFAFAIIASNFLIYSGFAYWNGGWSFGPRFLIPVIPFFSYGIALLLRNDERTRRSHVLSLYLILLAISVVNMGLGVATYPFSVDLPWVIARQNIPLFWRGADGMNVGELAGLSGIWPGLVFFAFLLVASGMMVARSFFNKSRVLLYSICFVIYFASTALGKNWIESRMDANDFLIAGRTAYFQGELNVARDLLTVSLQKQPTPAVQAEAGWLLHEKLATSRNSND